MPALRRPSELAGVMVRKCANQVLARPGTVREGGPQCAFTVQRGSSAERTPVRCRALGTRMSPDWSLLRQRPCGADGTSGGGL